MLDMTVATLVYGAGFAAALAVTLARRLIIERRVWRAGATLPTGKVSAYQMAMISGGASRVALTGVVRLLGRKVLVPGIAGVLTPGGGDHEPLDAVERETLAVARTPAVFPDLLARLEASLERKGVIAQLRRDLTAMGYVRSSGSRAWWAAYARNMLPFLAFILAVLGGWAGLARPADARDWLAGLGAGAGVTMLVVALPRRVTALGRYIVWSAAQHHPDLRTARATQGEAIDIKALGQSVALHGPDALVGSDMAWIPALLARAESSG